MSGSSATPTWRVETLRHHPAATQNAPTSQRIYERYAQALAHFQCLQIEDASAVARQALIKAALQPWPSPAVLRQTESQTKSFPAERALPLLLATLSQLAGRELVAFASGGSLLGLVREGRLLAHDKDVDIATPLAYFARVAQALPELGWQPAPIPLSASNFKRFAHPASGITLDLMGIEYDAETNTIVGGWWPPGLPRRAGRLMQFSPLSLELRHQGEQRYWVVAQPETLLAEMFGPDWRKPDPEFVGLFETPALVAHSAFSHVLGYLRLLEAWLGARPARFARLVQALRRLDADDPGLQQLPELPAAIIAITAFATIPTKVGAGETALSTSIGTAAQSARQTIVTSLRQSLTLFTENRIPEALASAQQTARQAAALPLLQPQPSPVVPIDTTLALPLLQNTLAQLASAGLRAFAFGGVVLGLVRDGRLLANDKDLDVVVPWPQFAAAWMFWHAATPLIRCPLEEIPASC